MTRRSSDLQCHDGWQRFCPDVLQRELHHQPSRGGDGERQRHDEWYAATYRAYPAAFGEPPPAAIWPAPGAGRETPPRRRFRPHPSWLLLLLPSLLTGVLYGQTIPFLLTGPQFLVFFWCFGAVSLFLLGGALVKARGWLSGQLRQRSGVDAMEAAYLAGGGERIHLLLLASLVAEGSLSGIENTGGYRIDRQKLRSSASPIAATLLAEGSDLAQLASLRSHAAGFAGAVAERFGNLRKQYRQHLLAACCRLLPLVLLFVLRFLQGVARGKPVTYLLVSALLLGLVCFIGIAQFEFSAASRTALRGSAGLFRTEPGELGRSIIFGGLAALAGWAVFDHLHRDLDRSGGGLGGGTGDGSGCSSGGCGSSCGGGGCGGGCGGCGG